MKKLCLRSIFVSPVKILTILAMACPFAASQIETPVSLNSLGAEDGSVSANGTVLVKRSGARAIRVGDGTDNVPYKGFLSFDTGSLPDQAVILGARLILDRATTRGPGPFAALGPLWVDLHNQGFGGNTDLEPTDYGAPPTHARVASIRNGDPAIAVLDARGRAAINREGTTQFRLYFNRDSNGDGLEDQVGFFPGERPDPSQKPRLEITYALVATPLTTVDITLDPLGPDVANPSQTLTGTVTPPEAHLTLEGRHISLDATGAFTVPVALNPGVNTYLFQGRAYAYLDAAVKRDLFLDGAGPVVNITAPVPNFHTNAETIDIHGIVEDLFDSQPTLRRDGQVVPVANGRFTERSLALVEGANTFNYVATDARGNQGPSVSLTVNHRRTPPQLLVTHPDQVLAGSNFTLSLAATPAQDLESATLALDGQQVYQGNDGAFTGSFTHEGESRSLAVHATAMDKYGNQSEFDGEIIVSHRHYLEGRVLDNATSLPKEGVQVQLATPGQSLAVTTDGEGRFQTYVSGLPLEVSVDIPGHFPIMRRIEAFRAGWRLPDLRVTALSPSTTGPYHLGRFTATFSGGLSGPARVTALTGQGLPALLPLGFSPAMGVHIAGAAGAGALTLETDAPASASGAEWVALQLENEGWRVMDTPTPAAGVLRAVFSNGGDGCWLVALRDPWSTGDPPTAGELLRRREDAIASGAIDALAVPPSVSITETPLTRLYVRMNSGAATSSGSRIRVRVQERHERYDQILNLPSDDLDLYCYHFDAGGTVGLAGQVGVHARAEVSPGLTRRAEMRFHAAPTSPWVPEFPRNRTLRLGSLTVDLSAAAQPIVAKINSALAPDLPKGLHSEESLVFDLWLGGLLDESAALFLEEPAGQAMVLLRQISGTQWAFAGQLTHDGQTWRNDPLNSEIKESGRYALVALAYPITEALGTVREGGQPKAGVRIWGGGHPWHGVSGDLGVYRHFLRQSPEPVDLHAFDPLGRGEGRLTVPATAGISLLTGQDVTLGTSEFRLVNHQPGDGAQFVSRSPQIALTFTDPLTLDPSNLTANIRLSSPLGEPIPLEIIRVPESFGAILHPRQALLQDTVYALTIDSGLTNLYGASIQSPVSFQFRTLSEIASGALDLSRFFLSWEQDQLTVNGPWEAFPDRTMLFMVNMNTASSWSAHLSGGVDFTFAVDGRPGDPIDLEARTPDGKVTRHRLELVRTGLYSWRLGTSPFAIEIEPGVVWRADEIGSGFGREVRIETAPTQDVVNAIAQTASLEGAPAITPLHALRITPTDGGPIPVLRGRFEIAAPITPEKRLVHLLSFSEGVMMPADPSQTVPTPHTLVQAHQTVSVENGAVQTKKGKVGGALLSLSFATDWNPGGNATLFAAVSMGLAEDALVVARIRGYRDPVDSIPPPSSPAPDWPDVSGVHVPGAALFRNILIGDESGFIPVGRTNERGEARLVWYGAPANVSGVDPVTGQIQTARLRRSAQIRDPSDIVLQYVLTQDVHFDSEWIPVTGPRPPRLRVAWEAGVIDNGQFVKNLVATENLRAFHTAEISDFRLRAVLKSVNGVALPQATATGALGLVQGVDHGPDSLVFLFPPSALSAARFLDIQFHVPDEADSEVSLSERIFVKDPATLGHDLPDAPGVVFTLPRHEEREVSVTDDLFVRFSEPVAGVPSGCELRHESGVEIPLDFLGGNGLIIGDGDHVEEVYLKPREALHFGARYTLVIANVIDQGGVALNMGSASAPRDFEMSFTTRHLPETKSLLIGENRKTVTHYRNLMLVSENLPGASGVTFHLFDVRDPESPPAPIWSSSQIHNGAWLEYRLALFTPMDLRPDTESLRPPSPNPKPVDDLPDGALITAVGFVGNSGLNQMALFEYRDKQVSRLATFNLMEQGLPRSLDQIGAYLAIGLNDFLGDGAVVVYDMRDLAAEVNQLSAAHQAGEISWFEFQSKAAAIAKADRFSQPTSPGRVDLFYRKTADGYKSTLLTSGREYPGIYDFNPARQAEFLPIPTGSLAYLDNRVLARTAYGPGTQMLRRYTGAIRQLAYRNPLNALLQVEDLAIFCERIDPDGQGRISIYRIPDAQGNLSETLTPLATLVLTDGLENMAVDEGSGLVAIQNAQGELSILDVAAVLEQNAPGATLTLDLHHGLFLLEDPTPATFVTQLNFHQGRLVGVDRHGSEWGVRFIPVNPRPFRTRGWAYFDLAAWSEAGPGDRTLPLRHADHMTFAATDLVKNNQARFHMELGTFAVTAFKGEKVEARFLDAAGGELPGGLMERAPAQTELDLQTFSLHPLLAYYRDPDRQRALREQGYEAFSFQYEIKKGPRIVARGRSSLVIVYQTPGGRTVDGYRNLGYLDALSQMPVLYEFDHDLTHVDPRLNLSLSRVYLPENAFQIGAFGGGMIDGRMLHLALPVWWDIAAMPDGYHGGDLADPRLVLAHHDLFKVQAKIIESPDGFGRVEVLNDLNSDFVRTSGQWRLTHRKRMAYHFQSGAPLPQYQPLFQQENEGLSQVDKAHEKLHYPVFRFPTGDNLPPSSLREAILASQVDLAWKNQMEFKAHGRPSEQPQTIVETVRDTGGARINRRSYRASAVGALVDRDQMLSDGMTVTYDYDSEGYLTQVARHGERQRVYEWESINRLSLGDFSPKRLKRIGQGDSWVEFLYDNPNALKVSGLDTPYGAKSLITPNRDGLGLPRETTLTGAGASPDRVLSFQSVDGEILTSSYGTQTTGDVASFDLTWLEICQASNCEWRLASDSFLGQTFAYNEGGLLVGAVRRGLEYAWDYRGDGVFFDAPVYYRDSLGQEFTIDNDTAGRARTIRAGDLFRTTYFSGSGAPIGARDLYGTEVTSGTSKFYVPDDGVNYRSENGRVTRIPVPGTELAAVEANYNRFGDLIKVIELGVTVESGNFDQSGLPRQLVLSGNVATSIDYTFVEGLLRVEETDQEAGISIAEFFNEMGWLVRRGEKIDGVWRYVTNSHDALGRVTAIHDEQTSEQLFFAVYDDETLQPERIWSPGEERIYQKSPNGQIAGLVRVIDGQPEAIRFETDALGRVSLYEKAGIGPLRVTYDAFDRPVSETRPGASKNQVGISYEYDEGTVTAHDGFKGISFEVRVRDKAGLAWASTLSGPGVGGQSIRREFETQVAPIQGRGYQFTESELGGEVMKTRKYSALGYSLGGAYGKYRFESDGTLGRYGQPLQFSGALTASADFDAKGRPISTTDIHGIDQAWTWDRFDRLTGGEDGRKAFEIQYFGSSADPKSIQVAGPNVGGGATVPVLERTNRIDAQAQSWLGATETLTTDQLGSVYTLSKENADGAPPHTAQVRVDRSTGLVQSLESFSGDLTQFSWENAGRSLRIQPPAGAPKELELDAFNQLRAYRHGGVSRVKIARDSENRIARVETGGRTLDYQYEEEDLTAILGGDHPIFFEAQNGLGLPEVIRVGDLATLSVDYYQGGVPSCVTVQSKGGLATSIRANPFGDLTEIQRGHQPPVRFTHNEWGAPASIQVGDQPPLALFSGQDLTFLQLPGQVMVEVDQEGRLQEIRVPGLAPKQYGYDPDGRIDRVLIDGEVQETYAYAAGLLTERRLGQNPNARITTFGHDQRGRLASASSDLDGDFSFTYGLDETQLGEDQPNGDLIRTYTDANGVTYHYQYREDGRVVRLDLENGPTFLYDYDEAGNLLGVAVDGMAARYEGYQNGLPATVRWQTPTQPERVFTVDQNASGRLTAVTGDDFALSLGWSGDEGDPNCQTPGAAPPMISRVVRGGPGFQETWDPDYDANQQLIAVTMTRRAGSDVANPNCADCAEQVIQESYGPVVNKVMGELRRTVDGLVVLGAANTLDSAADRRRVLLQDLGPDQTALNYDPLGNLASVVHGSGETESISYDGDRRVRQIDIQRSGFLQSESYAYDLKKRRIRRSAPDMGGDIVYAWHESKVIAIGMANPDGTTQWTHAIGRGPMGPVFLKDLGGTGMDAFIFPDHLGTPFAYHSLASDQVYYTPFNPWGELLASHPEPAPPYASEGAVPTWGFQLPPDPVFAMPPLGLSGHVYDQTTGLVYMHHRYYHPRLGHFLTPDFRVPDIYDPTTFTEPYAYAAGNPIMFWDPDGRAVEYIGDGRVKIEARDIHGALQTLYMPQDHWVKLVTGQSIGYGHYTGEYFKLKAGVPDLTTDQGKAHYKIRANAVLDHFFGPGTQITKGVDEITEDIGLSVLHGSLLTFGLAGGASSGFRLVRGLSYTAEAGLSGYGIYDGSIRAYEGDQEGSYLKTSLALGEIALSGLGLYGSARGLKGAFSKRTPNDDPMSLLRESSLPSVSGKMTPASPDAVRSLKIARPYFSVEPLDPGGLLKGDNLARMGPDEVFVAGSLIKTEEYMGLKGYQALSVKRWSPSVNTGFILRVIRDGRIVNLVSRVNIRNLRRTKYLEDGTYQSHYSQFHRELKMLKYGGYVREGKSMLPGPNWTGRYPWWSGK